MGLKILSRERYWRGRESYSSIEKWYAQREGGKAPSKSYKKGKEKSTSTPMIVQPLPKIALLFLQCLKKKNEDDKFL